MDERLTRRYGSEAGAAAYRRKYAKSWTRRLSNRREMAALDQALADGDVSGHVLDCPCGAGRLVPTLLRRADRVTAVDLSEAMVSEARDALAEEAEAGRVEFAVASAGRLPHPDGTFDAAVCHRLLHHLPTREERSAVLAELARVSRRSVVTSFSDATTWKARWQSVRGKDRRRIALRPADFLAEAREHRLVPAGPVRRLCGLTSLVAVVAFRVGTAG